MRSISRTAKLGISGAAIALVAAVGFGFTPPPEEEQLPVVKVFHDPT